MRHSDSQGRSAINSSSATYSRPGLLLNIAGRIRLGLDDMEAGAATLQTLSAADRARMQALPPLFEVADEIVAEATLAQHLAGAGRFIEARTYGDHAVATMPSSALSAAEEGTLLRDAYLGLARAYAALGLPERARDAFGHARALYAAIGHHMMLGVTLLIELDQAMIPYYADRISERRRIAAEAEAAYAKASTAAPDQQPRIARVPLLILEGDWIAARQCSKRCLGRLGHSRACSARPSPPGRGMVDLPGNWCAQH